LRLAPARPRRLAEYRADDISARLAGTEAAVKSLSKVLVMVDSRGQLARAALYKPRADLWHEYRTHIATFPPRQRIRLRRINQLSATSVYSRHPGVHRRIAYLDRRPLVAPAPLPAESLWPAVDTELEPLIRLMGVQIFNEVRAGLTPGQLEALGQH
jgi:hypothetical protein